MDEVKSQFYVKDVLYRMRNHPIPPHKHDRELALSWAAEFEEAYQREMAAMAAMRMKVMPSFVLRCHHCHEKLDSVNLNCFRINGSDDWFPHGICLFGINDVGDPFVEVRTNMAWTGEDLSDGERLETVTCPKCGKYPFGGGTMNTFGALSIVLFPSKEDVEIQEGGHT